MSCVRADTELPPLRNSLVSSWRDSDGCVLLRLFPLLFICDANTKITGEVKLTVRNVYASTARGNKSGEPRDVSLRILVRVAANAARSD